MSVTLSEVKRAAKAHRAPLAGESAGYLVLAIADQVLSAPRMVQGTDIQLTEDGGLRVLSGRASSDADAELALRRALESLLIVASSGSAALTRASRRTSGVGLSGLVRELEAALIPVNRAAARRALARIHRETARALASGSLPEDDLEPVLPMAAVAPVSVTSAAPAGTVVAAPVVEPISKEPVPWEAASEDSDALTVALEVKPLDRADQLRCDEIELLADIDVVLESEVESEPVESESGATPTVVAARVAAIPDLILTELPAPLEAPVDMPVEACTRPEPVVLRKSLRSELTEVAPLVASEPSPPVSEPLPHTPTLGTSFAQLPALAPELIAELSAAHAEHAVESLASSAPSMAAMGEAADAPPPALELEPDEAELERCSAPVEECTELMPEVAPLAPGVAIIASRKSDVSELLSSFQVAQSDANQGLCRAIKDLAGLDLTPAPFAALIR